MSGVRHACGLGSSARLLAYAGQLSSEPGIATAVEALPKLPRCHLALVADPAEPGLADLLARAGVLGVRDRVHVVARPDDAQLSGYLASADFAVLGFATPRPDGQEQGPLPGYRAAGLTVLAADSRLARDRVVRRNLGEVFRVGDADSFVSAVRRATRRGSRVVRTVGKLRKAGSSLVRTARQARTDQTPVMKAVVHKMKTHTAAPGPAIAEPRRSPQSPPWRALGTAPIRLGLGTANHAGQLSAFAQAICRERPDVSAELVMARAGTPFMYPADIHMDPSQQALLDVQLAQAARVLGGYTHLIADAFRPVLGWLNGTHVDGDLPALKQAGIKVALLGHGSEVRHPQRHLDRHPHSMFLDVPPGIGEQLTVLAERSRRTVADSGLPVFVTTPDLLDDLPEATWAPLVVDPDMWACDRPVLERRRPLVLHAPSRRWTKGTGRILPVMKRLEERGLIEFRLVEGMPWNQMRELVQDADIILDQLVMGSYCTFACEGMAAGKPVIAYLSESAHEAVGVRPPIVDATPDTLAAAVESLLDDREWGARLGAESVAYVREYHDGRRTAAAFADFLR